MSYIAEIEMRRARAVKPPKTRDRILEAGRILFNEQGYSNVTLAHIGMELKVSEGNVWYHFHTKPDLVFDLFIEYEQLLKTYLEQDVSNLQQVSQLEELLTQGFQLLWEYRFLSHDYIDFIAFLPELQVETASMIEKGRIFMENILKRMQQLGWLEMSLNVINPLATSFWIMHRYWIDYCQTRSERPRLTWPDIQEGIRHLYALIAPYLTPAGREVFPKAIR